MEEVKVEDMVYRYLCQNHRGKDMLIKNKNLRKLFNIGSDKSMRKIIQNIREDEKYREVIGSVSGQSGGFYMCTTNEEKEETINNIRHRAKQMLKMCDVLEIKRKLEE